jgi:DNA primase
MEIIDQIRQAANIVDIASQYTTLRMRGRKHVGLCPFHSEKSPSFTVDQEKQLFHCFGCGAGGDLFTLVMEKENLSFPEALRYLAEKYNIPLPQRKFSPQIQKLEEQLRTISETALAYFKKNLFSTAEGRKALDYLHKRKISDDIIQKFKIGYALNTWDSLITFFKAKEISPKLLEKAGLAVYNQAKDSYYDRFRGRIIFPIFNLSGTVIAFGGRSTVNAEPKYLNSPDTPIYSKGRLLYGLNFCKEDIREKKEIILVEGYTDFISLYQAGITNLAASLGTSVTSQQVDLALRFAPKMIVGFDADEAGRKASWRAVSLSFEKGLRTFVLKLPEGLDPDSFVQKHGAERLRRLIKASPAGLNFLIDAQMQEGNVAIPEEKARIARSVVNEIHKIPDPVVRSEYFKLASEQLNLSEDVLRSMLQKQSEMQEKTKEEILLPAEKRLLQIIFEDSLIAAKILKETEDEDFKELKSAPLFKKLSDYLKKGKTPSMHEFREEIDRSLFSALARILLEKRSSPSFEEALDCLDALKKRTLEKRRKELLTQIATLEKRGKREDITALLHQIHQVTEELSSLTQRDR